MKKASCSSSPATQHNAVSTVPWPAQHLSCPLIIPAAQAVAESCTEANAKLIEELKQLREQRLLQLQSSDHPPVQVSQSMPGAAEQALAPAPPNPLVPAWQARLAAGHAFFVFWPDHV